MADLSDTALNLMLTALAGAAVYGSLHTADPGLTGLNEVAGGSPAYARKPITWSSAVGASIDTSVVQTFDVPASTTVTHWGLWSAPTGGTWYGAGPLATGTEVYNGQGKLRVQVGTVGLP